MLLEKLSSLRESMGWAYGSEDLCVLLYSLVKRTRPRIVVELGTGFGVTAAWLPWGTPGRRAATICCTAMA
ncbi:hypothetical protein D3C72_1988360 [compost metagenome]